MTIRSLRVLFIVSLFVTSPVWPDALMENFDVSVERRVPGQYDILFKAPRDLEQVRTLLATPGARITRPGVLPDTMPISVEDTSALISSISASLGGKAVAISHARYGFGAQFSVRGVTDQAIKRLVDDPRIEVIAPSTYAYPDSSQGTLNDPQGQDSADYLWHLDRVDQTTGSLDNSYTYYASGGGVDVWILDTGLFGDPGNGPSDFSGGSLFWWDCTTGSCGVGYDVNHCNVSPTERTQDLNGHGTQVAGVVGGRVHGVAKQATLNSVKVLGDCTYSNGVGTTANFIAGMELVLSNHMFDTSDVVNFSAHFFSPNSAVDTEVKKVIAGGIPVVVAAGDSVSDACSFSPGELNMQAGGYPGLLVVGGSTRSDQMDSAFAYGGCVSLFAPDERVLTTGAPWGAACSTCTWRNGTAFPYTAEVWSAGTSMSVPIVTGIVALYQQTHPSATPAQVKAAVLAAGRVGLLGNNVHGSPNILANSCVPGNNPTLDPNAAGCPGSGGGGGTGGGDPTRSHEAAIQAGLNILLLN